MNTPTNNNNKITQRFPQPLRRPMRLRDLIGILFLISSATAVREDFTLVTQKVGEWAKLCNAFGSKKHLEIMNIYHNTDGWYQENSWFPDNALKIEGIKHDIPNNRMWINMTPDSHMYTGVTPRYIYYLEQDGPRFMEYLINLYPEFGPSEDIKRGQWKEVSPGNWESAEGKDDSIIGYTATLMKDTESEKTLQSKTSQMKNLYEVRVHMKLNNTVKYFETSRGKFEIANITGFSEHESRIHLETKKAYGDDDSDEPADVWLYFGPAYYNKEDHRRPDSMRFLFFLVEHYLFKGSGENLFDTSGDALLTWLRGQQEEVKEWITDSNATYGLVDPDKAGKFKVFCGLARECPQCQGWGNHNKMDCPCKCDLGKWVARHPKAGSEEIQTKGEKLMQDLDVQYCDACSMTGINNCTGKDADPKGGTAWPLTADYGCPEDERCEKCTCSTCDGAGFVPHDYQKPVDPEHSGNDDDAERRRIAEDNIEPSVALCAWIVALTVGVAIFLLDRHAKVAKRDAMQRGQRNWECSLF